VNINICALRNTEETRISARKCLLFELSLYLLSRQPHLLQMSQHHKHSRDSSRALTLFRDMRSPPRTSILGLSKFDRTPLTPRELEMHPKLSLTKMSLVTFFVSDLQLGGCLLRVNHFGQLGLLLQVVNTESCANLITQAAAHSMSFSFFLCYHFISCAPGAFLRTHLAIVTP
jgi:hypothetical protein